MTYFAGAVRAAVTDVEALPGEDVVTLNIVMGDWNIVDGNDAVLAAENWQSMLKRLDDFCTASGIAPVDITSFARN